MRVLGAVLAGGRSRRYGSDKARAMIDGRTMLDHVAERLRGQSEAVVVIGRPWPGMPCVPDRPTPGLGPLGGLAGALAHARDHGFDAVLTCGCDIPDLPRTLALGAPNVLVNGQPTIGLWDSALADRLVAWLEATDDRSIRSWAAEAGARWIAASPTANINTPADLAMFSADRSASD